MGSGSVSSSNTILAQQDTQSLFIGKIVYLFGFTLNEDFSKFISTDCWKIYKINKKKLNLSIKLTFCCHFFSIKFFYEILKKYESEGSPNKTDHAKLNSSSNHMESRSVDRRQRFLIYSLSNTFLYRILFLLSLCKYKYRI